MHMRYREGMLLRMTLTIIHYYCYFVVLPSIFLAKNTDALQGNVLQELMSPNLSSHPSLACTVERGMNWPEKILVSYV